MRKKKERNIPIGVKRKILPSFLVSCSLGEDIAEDPVGYAIASLLCRHVCLQEKVTKGIIDNAGKVLRNDLTIGGMYLKKKQIKRIFEGDSAFWHWDKTQKDRLIVTLFDAIAEDDFTYKSITGANNSKGNKKENKSSESHTFAGTTVPTTVGATVGTKTPIKERKDFPSENLSNGGGSTEVAPRSFDDSISDDDSKPLSPEAKAAFIEKMRRELSDDTEQASNQSAAAGSEAKSTPETKNASECP